MSRLKQKYRAYKTAEKLYVQRKVALRNEYKKILTEHAKKGDWDAFDDVCTDFKIDLNNVTSSIILIETLYKRPKETKYIIPKGVPL